MGKILSSHGRGHRQDAISSLYSYNAAGRIHGHSNQIIEDVSKGYSGTINVGVNELPWRIHTWLSPLEPYGRHQDVSSGRPGGVGNWVLGRNEFKAWCESQNGLGNPILLCYGDKEVGETYMSSLIIDTLCEQARQNAIAVLFFYCDSRMQKDQSVPNIIGCLLRQFAIGAVGIPQAIRSAFEESGQGYRRRLQLPKMVKLFIKTIMAVERAYIIIDAVDELPSEDRSQLLGALGQISREASNTRLCLTGRRHICNEIEKHFTDGAYSINLETNRGDIAKHINKEMDAKAPDVDVLTEDATNDIMEGMWEKDSESSPPLALKCDNIVGGRSENILKRREWPYCEFGSLVKTRQMSPSIAPKTGDILEGCSKTVLVRSLPIAGRFDDISRETRLAMQKEMLQKVAMNNMDLDSLYGETLQQIRQQKGDLPRIGMKVLMWVSHAERPLRMDELYHALEIDVETADFHPNNIRSQETVLGSCLGLVMAEKRTLKVRLIHDTLQQYLSRPGILSGAHKVLSETCLAYLNYGQVKRLRASMVDELANFPFLEYSSLYWGTHAKIELSERAKTLALELLENFENHISFTHFFKRTVGIYYLDPRYRFTGLHCASYIGIDPLVATLIRVKSCDINQEDAKKYTPLMWAVQCGNHEVVRLLLTCDGVDPNHPAFCGVTPLWWASSYGDEEMVRLLIEGGADPTQPDDNGKTPLMMASGNRHIKKLALLQPQPITISDLD